LGTGANSGGDRLRVAADGRSVQFVIDQGMSLFKSIANCGESGIAPAFFIVGAG
jgi:hypothetical protein